MVKKVLIAGMILVAGVITTSILLIDWETRAVKKQLRAIAREMSWAPADSELTMAARIKHVQEKIFDTCRVDIPSYNVSQNIDKNDVPTYMMMAKRYYKDLSVKLEDLHVDPIELPQARAVTTAHVKATGTDGQRNDEVLMMEFILQKIEKKWLVTSVSEMAVIEQ